MADYRPSNSAVVHRPSAVPAIHDDFGRDLVRDRPPCVGITRNDWKNQFFDKRYRCCSHVEITCIWWEYRMKLKYGTLFLVWWPNNVLCRVVFGCWRPDFSAGQIAPRDEWNSLTTQCYWKSIMKYSIDWVVESNFLLQKKIRMNHNTNRARWSLTFIQTVCDYV